MKTSKSFYGIALASFVSFTAAADNVPASQPTSTTSTTTLPTVQKNIIIQGTVTTANPCPKPIGKPVTVPNPVPAINNGVVNQGT